MKTANQHDLWKASSRGNLCTATPFANVLDEDIEGHLYRGEIYFRAIEETRRGEIDTWCVISTAQCDWVELSP